MEMKNEESGTQQCSWVARIYKHKNNAPVLRAIEKTQSGPIRDARRVTDLLRLARTSGNLRLAKGGQGRGNVQLARTLRSQ